MSRKKSFKPNIHPAMQFISAPQKAPGANENSPDANTPSGAPNDQLRPNGPHYTDQPSQPSQTNSNFPETKSKRLQLLLQPSLFEKLKQKAYAQGRSVNSLVHEILKEAMEEARGGRP